MKPAMIRDTGAWQMQVWMSFAIAVFLCAVGLAYLPGADLDRVFMIMGYLFCLSNVFVLSKMIRDNQKARHGRPRRYADVQVRGLVRLPAGDGADRMGAAAHGYQ
jgi:hypothetical protein